MKVVLNGRCLGQKVTGVQAYARYVFCHFEASGPHSNILVPNVAFHDDKINCKKVGLRGIKGHFWEQFILPFYSWGKVLFCPGNSAPILSLLFGRVVVTVHCLSYERVPADFSLFYCLYYRFLTPLIMRAAISVITVSESEKRNLVERFPLAASKIKVIFNGAVTKQEAASRPTPIVEGSRSAEIKILFVGIPRAKKNFKVFAQVCEMLSSSGKSVEPIVVGGNLVDVDAELLRKYNFSNYRFMGQVNDRSEMLGIYTLVDLLLFPSVFESSGLPPLEAMAFGCPVVCSDIDALRERCGDAALYADVDDAFGFYRAACSMLYDESKRRDMVARGYVRVESFLWEDCARATCAEIFKYT